MPRRNRQSWCSVNYDDDSYNHILLLNVTLFVMTICIAYRRRDVGIVPYELQLRRGRGGGADKIPGMGEYIK